jgi:putative endonuclease
MKMHKSGIGREGEERAGRFLEEKGMGIIARNFRSRQGEIDLIALDGDTLIFVEVKTWSFYGIEDLPGSISENKQRRIIETAKYFLSVNRKYNEKAVRFDVIFISPEKIIHLASAFMERV